MAFMYKCPRWLNYYECKYVYVCFKVSDAVRDYGSDAIVWNELDGVFILHYMAIEPLFLPSFASISEVSTLFAIPKILQNIV